jgi:hypothetical protein
MLRLSSLQSSPLLGAALAIASLLAGCSGKPQPARYHNNGSRAPQLYEAPPEQLSLLPPLPPPGISDAEWAARFSMEPRTELVSIGSIFDIPQDILTTSRPAAVLARLRGIASATPEYHEELLGLVTSAERIDAAHLALVAQATYFHAELCEKMESIASGLVRRPDALAQLQLEAILRNIARARALGAFTDQILAEGLPKIPGLSAEAGLELLRQLVPGALAGLEDPAEASLALEAFVGLFPELELGPERELIDLAKAKRAYAFASSAAIRWFARSEDQSSAALRALAQGFPPGDDLDGLILEATTDLGTASPDDVRALAGALRFDSAIAEGAPALIAVLDALQARDLESIAGAIRAGSARDAAVLESIQLIDTLTEAEMDALLALFHLPENREIASHELSAKKR